jgi:hypothetical protein
VAASLANLCTFVEFGSFNPLGQRFMFRSDNGRIQQHDENPQPQCSGTSPIKKHSWRKGY